MRIVVRMPAMFQHSTGAEVVLDEAVSDIAGVREALARRFPDIARDLEDPILNVAVNDVMLLHGVRQYPVRDGDVIEIVPTIAGG
jgi:molybdopterin converting factor small subunit